MRTLRRKLSPAPPPVPASVVDGVPSTAGAFFFPMLLLYKGDSFGGYGRTIQFNTAWTGWPPLETCPSRQLTATSTWQKELRYPAILPQPVRHNTG